MHGDNALGRRIGQCGLVVLLLLSARGAGAQTGPCGTGNARNWCADQSVLGGSVGAEANDAVGSALAFGDFNGDGYRDLAVGASGEDVGSANSAGLVHVFYGSASGLHLKGQQFLTQAEVAGADNGAQAGDEFGAALAAADFDADGFDDLAIGSPGESIPGGLIQCGADFTCTNAGLVQVVPGGAGGLVVGSATSFELDTLQAGNLSNSDGNRFGAALAAGRLDGDAIADLAIGVPESDISQLSNLGDVVLVYGAASGIGTGAGAIRMPGSSENCEGEGERLGTTLAFGSFHGTGDLDLAVGAPDCKVAGTADTGGAYLFTGATIDDLIVQTDFGSAGNGANDHFGSALAVGDFDGDGRDDLAIGAPDKDDFSTVDSGRVYVAYGAASGLDLADFQLVRWSSFPGQTAQANDRLGAALAAGDYDGDGRDDLFLGSPGKGSDDRGFVYFVRGSGSGLTTGAGFVFSEPSVGGTAQANAHFGAVLALGDIDGDGAEEIAIGVPDRDVDGANDAGAVYVTRFLEPNWIFGDGFESAAIALWSGHQP